MRFPGTNIHPMSSSSVCWVSQQKILKIIKKHPEKFEELFQTYIVHQINKESLDDQSEDGLIKFIDELTEGDRKLKRFPKFKEFVERIVKLPRKTQTRVICGQKENIDKINGYKRCLII